MIPLRPCLDCGRRTHTTSPRCGPCDRAHQRARNAARAALYDTAHRRQSKAARKAQPWCSLCGITADLTWDHEHRQVECRSCNSSHRREATS